MKRFTSYLIREILPLYGAGVIAFVLLLLGEILRGQLAGILARGVPPALVAQFLIFSLPFAIGTALPLGLLFASLLGLTRLTQDSEIKAALLLGLSPRQFVVPLLTLGVIVALLSFFNNEVIVPWSQQRALEVQKDILLQSPDTFLEEGSFFTDALGRSIFIESLEPGGVFKNITVIQSGGSQGPREVYSASQGIPDEASGIWRLEGVRFSTYRNNRVVLDAQAETAILPVRQLAAGGNLEPELTQLPFRDLLLRLQEEGFAKPAEWTALHRKLAQPAAAITFALFALAVALVSFRSAFGLGLVSVLFLTFIYYATWSVMNILGAQGTIPAWLAGWTPVMLYALAGGALLSIAWRR
jgi:lipopolysaccharide export system permease protein